MSVFDYFHMVVLSVLLKIEGFVPLIYARTQPMRADGSKKTGPKARVTGLPCTVEGNTRCP